MDGAIAFTVCSLFFSILLTVIYFSKKRLPLIENKIYSILIVSNLVGTIIHILCGIVTPMADGDFSSMVFSKLYLGYLLTWVIIFTIYVFVISKNKEKTNKIDLKKYYYKVFLYFTIIYLIFLTMIFLLDIRIYNSNGIVYTYGPSVNCIYVFSFTCAFIMLVCMLCNLKNIISKKYLPIFSYMALSGVVGMIQFLHPELLLATAMETFITFLMYFTIENPDMKMIEQLNVAKTTAEKANRAKSDFLSSMSHEIRTPLNAIVGFSECIKSSDNLDEAKDNANDVITASQTLLEIVNGILDISKIESGKLELVQTDYDTKKLFKEVEKLIIARIGDKQLDFKVNIAEDIPNALYGDHFNIKKILINLLTNAVKYTDSGYVNLSVKCVKNNEVCRLIISVKDSGRGIKKENIDKLFTKFNRLDEDKNTTIEGTGLGLAITKQLVDMMGGKIVVNSVYGEGSEFSVAIDQKISNKVFEEEIEEVEFIDLSGKKILLVDDNKLNLKVAVKLLMPYHAIIEVCESGFECIDKINAGNSYDLILMDDMMPKLRGPEVLNKLKENPNFNTPVIALTANAINGIKEQYINMGFNDYLAKPIAKEDLNDILSRFLGRRIEKKIEEPKKEVGTENKKVLIVDDNKLNIKIAIRAMMDYKFQFEEVYNGMDAIEKVKNNKYDLIFMDYMMPEMDGIETLNKLKEIPNFNTPVIALTADAIDGARERFLSAGFDEYIAKPIDKGLLNEAIIKIIETKLLNVSNKGNINYLKENSINVDVGLNIFGTIELYNDTLSYFAETIEERLVKLNNWKQKNDMTNYAIEINAFKSDCNYLGFDKLLQITTNHEKESRNNNVEFINNDYQNLINEIRRLVSVIKEYI